MPDLNILCIDDQRAVLASLRRDLADLMETFEVIDCESAAEAAEVMEEIDARGGHVVLLICDHVMPEKNGVDFLTEVKHDSRFRHTRKLLLTGLATHEDTIEAINKADVDHYMDKPWDQEQLLAVVRTLITGYVLRAGLEYQPLMKYLDQEALWAELRNRT
ncbi:MAG: response regulator [Rhodothermales bacterium]|nr:response regulator [Rhodothermales bacterium]